MQRIAGFYWVRLRSDETADPIVAYWDEEHLSWMTCGSFPGFHEGHFVQLSARLEFGA